MSSLVVPALLQANEILNGLHARRLVNNADKERLRIHQNYSQLLNKLDFFHKAELLTRENSSAIITQLLTFKDTDNHLEFILHMLRLAHSLKELDLLKLICGLAKPSGNALSFLAAFCVESTCLPNNELGELKKKLFGALVLLKKLGYLNETDAYALLETIIAAKSMRELSQLLETEFKAKLISSNDKAYALWSTRNIKQTLEVLTEYPNVEELLYNLMGASDAKRIVKMLTLHKDRLFSGQYLDVNSFFLFNFTQVERLCRCLLKIHEANLLPKIGVDNFISLCCSDNPKLTMDALLKLDKNKLLDGEEGQANLNFLLAYPAFIASLTEALIILQKSEMLTGPQGTFCREFIVSNQRSSAGIMAQQMANGLKLLYLNSLQDDIGRLKNTFAPYNLAYEFVELKKAN
ncbi:hypothetical protein [Legionella sp. km772]|uniref:hypothetical protein n=1 Tax=Legionella sp. km772 TaxID=2498111 RepID=UPI000F8DEDBF|nr:hypothetical protein [Legionella sp. km772]RUR09161.1 hypothetical protein ELY15_09570 [Legionella sp. km772]